MNKKLYFFLVNLLILVDFTNFTFVVPIIPDFLQNQNVSLSLIGLILSFYQIGFFITSLYLSKKIFSQSKNNVLLFGQIILIITNLALGFLDNGLSSLALIILSSVFRIMQGCSLAIIAVVIYASFPLLYNTNLDQKYAIAEICVGFGFTLGPLIGGFLYEYLDYAWSFHIMSMIYSVTALILLPFIWRYEFDVKEENNIESLENNAQITYSKIIKNSNFLLTFAMFILSYMSYFLVQPSFSDHIHRYGGSDDTVGIIFGIVGLAYALTGFFLIFFLTKIKLARKYLFIFGGSMSAISLLLAGPEDYTYLPKNLTTVCIGMAILGFSQMFYISTLIAEYLDIFQEIDPQSIGKNELASGIFNASIALSEYLGAVLGGVLSDYYGFSRGMSIYAIILLGFIVIFAIFRK